MPTILPPKRRRIRGKREKAGNSATLKLAMENAYKNFQDESVGARLSTEFKRHNWLQKKLANPNSAEIYSPSKEKSGDAGSVFKFPSVPAERQQQQQQQQTQAQVQGQRKTMQMSDAVDGIISMHLIEPESTTEQPEGQGRSPVERTPQSVIESRNDEIGFTSK